MFDFLTRSGKSPAITPAPDVETLVNQLTNAIKAQHAKGYVTTAELQKLVQLANDGARLRNALRFL